MRHGTAQARWLVVGLLCCYIVPGVQSMYVPGSDESLISDRICEGSTSRPSPEGLDKLKDTFNSTFGAMVEKVLAQQQGDVIFTVGENHSVPLLENFMSHAKQASGSGDAKTRLVHISLDTQDHDTCKFLQGGLSNLVCLDLSGWIPLAELSEGSDFEDQSHGSAGFMSCTFWTIGWARTVMYPWLIEASRGSVAMMDLDVILHKDLIQWMKNKTASSGSLVLAGDEGSTGVNIGVLYAEKAALPLMKSWTEKTESRHTKTPDQDAMSDLLRENPGKWQTIGRDILGECAVVGEYATHYNCVDNKITAMTKQGHWIPADHAPSFLDLSPSGHHRFEQSLIP